MMDNIKSRYIRFTLKWHFEAKSLALRNAVTLRCPLSVEQSKQLRLNYSEYFAHLVSATELLLEPEYKYREQFKQTLEAEFTFDEWPDGNHNYAFIRELRNSIIHRGHDITSASHVDGDFLMIITPESVTNRTGNRVYESPCFYLIDIIKKCEATIGPAIRRHLDKVGILHLKQTQAESIDESISFVEESKIMPKWAKKMALYSIGEIDFLAMQQSQIENLIELLNTNALDKCPTIAFTLSQAPPA